MDPAKQNLFNRIRIQKDLESISGAALSRTPQFAEAVIAIADLAADDQEFIYHWARVISVSNDELAAHFISKVPQAFARLNRGAVEEWIIVVMDAFDKRGLGFAIEAVETVDAFAEQFLAGQTDCRIDEVQRFLQQFIKGLGGRALQIAHSGENYTDTEHIYLQERLEVYPESELNGVLYKALCVFLWAQNRYGTWQYHALEEAIHTLEAEREWPVYQRLEALRLEAKIALELPGIARAMTRLCDALGGEDPCWEVWRRGAAALQDPGATARDALHLVVNFRDLDLPRMKPYHASMYPGRVREVMFSRIPEEKTKLQKALGELREQLDSGSQDEENIAAPTPGEKPPSQFELQHDGDQIQLSFGDQVIPTSDQLHDLLESILQDLGGLEDSYLEQEGPSAPYPENHSGRTESDAGDDDANDTPTFMYPEWDYTRQRFREDFCTLREQDIEADDEAFVIKTREKYRGLSKSIHRAFEAILTETRKQRRQQHGDDVDIDALVESHADRRNGLERDERLYSHLRQTSRSVAVMFMVDMSGSTKGWVNDAERESLILLCEALETLGDDYAIYGFSGRTHKRCEVYRVKRFTEKYGAVVRCRIAAMTPKTYTRMGAPIRHLGALLAEVPARNRLLITISDGKPEDYGSYRGRYGVEDTRHALLEIKQNGINAFCITIDKEARNYLPHMYGPANFAVIDDVQKLPHKVADIYRRLTT